MSEIQVNPQAWIRILDNMIEDRSYSFARDTLRDIREWVEANDHITRKQITAIQNIRRSRR